MLKRHLRIDANTLPELLSAIADYHEHGRFPRSYYRGELGFAGHTETLVCAYPISGMDPGRFSILVSGVDQSDVRDTLREALVTLIGGVSVWDTGIRAYEEHAAKPRYVMGRHIERRQLSVLSPAFCATA